MKTNLVFIISGLFIILSFNIRAQLPSVSGYVKNGLTGEVIKDATVFESISGVGTISNRDGFYRLLLIPAKQELEISSPAYNPYKTSFKLIADTVIIVELIPLHLPNTKSGSDNDYMIEPFASSDADTKEVETK
jgi:hypothetical protein